MGSETKDCRARAMGGRSDFFPTFRGGCSVFFSEIKLYRGSVNRSSIGWKAAVLAGLSRIRTRIISKRLKKYLQFLQNCAILVTKLLIRY